MMRRHAPALLMAGLVFLTHVVTNATMPYELHRDAFLYLAMGEHLRLWSMDFPPFIAIVAETTRALFGDSIVAIRLGPALAHSATVLMAGVFARELGGGRAAQVLAALVLATAPVYLRAGVLFQPVVFDQLWWTLALFALLRAGRAAARKQAGPRGDREPEPGDGSDGPADEARRWWLVLGVVMGLALLTKLTALVLGLAVLSALLVSPQRRVLATPWPWVAAAIALALGSPSIVGQIRLEFPVMGQMADLQEAQLARLSLLDFVTGQIMEVGPMILLGWAGAAALLVRKELRPYRVVGWSAVAAFLIMMALSAKSYYIAPIYPALIGVGAAEAARWTRSLASRGLRLPALALYGGLYAIALVFAVSSFPMGIPVLDPPRMARYAAGLGDSEAVRTNTGEILSLPQDYADMLGWERLVENVALVYHDLPEPEQRQAVILGSNYGEAGAIDFYGPRYGLGKAIAFVGSYWFWGPGERPGEVVIAVGYEEGDLDGYFGSVELARRVENGWGVPEQRNVRIEIGRGPHRTLQELWPGFRGRN